MAMDTSCFSESIYNLIPIDWKEPPQPPRYVGKQRLSLETRIGKNYCRLRLTASYDVEKEITYIFVSVKVALISA